MRSPAIPAQDFTEILNLYAYYNHCSDDADADAYVTCFAMQGRLHIPSISLLIEGREALHEFKRNDAARRGNRIRRHWNSGMNLEQVDADRIRGQCYLHGYNGEPGQLPKLVDVGRYDDTLIREQGEWRFLERIILMDFSSFSVPGSS